MNNASGVYLWFVDLTSRSDMTFAVDCALNTKDKLFGRVLRELQGEVKVGEAGRGVGLVPCCYG